MSRRKEAEYCSLLPRLQLQPDPSSNSMAQRLEGPDDVNPSRAALRVWIVDDDLGFVLWLGEIFAAIGCQALPALSTGQAALLMHELRLGIDLLVVNPALRGVRGMLQNFRRANPNLKIVVIVKACQAFTATIHPQANLERPLASAPVSRPEWLEKARILLKQVNTSAAN